MNVMRIVFLVLVAFLAILFRRSAKRIYQTKVHPVVMKGVDTLRVGL